MPGVRTESKILPSGAKRSEPANPHPGAYPGGSAGFGRLRKAKIQRYPTVKRLSDDSKKKGRTTE